VYTVEAVEVDFIPVGTSNSWAGANVEGIIDASDLEANVLKTQNEKPDEVDVAQQQTPTIINTEVPAPVLNNQDDVQEATGAELDTESDADFFLSEESSYATPEYASSTSNCIPEDGAICSEDDDACERQSIVSDILSEQSQPVHVHAPSVM